jgi:hypothetical protein
MHKETSIPLKSTFVNAMSHNKASKSGIFRNERSTQWQKRKRKSLE